MKKFDGNYKNNKPKLKIQKNSKSAESPVSSENFNVPLEIATENFRSCPETAEEMVNAYGTYNIQPTADNDNNYPAIAQGTPDYIKEKPLEFFRHGEPYVPTSNSSKKNKE